MSPATARAAARGTDAELQQSEAAAAAAIKQVDAMWDGLQIGADRIGSRAERAAARDAMRKERAKVRAAAVANVTRIRQEADAAFAPK